MSGFVYVGTDGIAPVVWAAGETVDECERELADCDDPGETHGPITATDAAMALVKSGQVALTGEWFDAARAHRFIGVTLDVQDGQLALVATGA